MFTIFEGLSASDVWIEAARAFAPGGPAVDQESRGGRSREILHALFAIKDPRQRWVLSRQPALNPAFALAEVVWILAGRRDAAFITYFNRSLSNYAGNDADFHGAYGYRLRSQLGIDQLHRAYSALARSRDSRQVVLQIWDGRVDLPKEDGTPASADIPCNIVSLLKVRAGALEWTQILRSNDLFRGTPYNFIQFTSLHEIVAGWLGVGLGTYHQLSDSLHIYHDDAASFSQPMTPVVVQNSDDLTLPFEESARTVTELEKRIEWMARDDVPSHALVRAVEQSELPTPYRNWLCVLSAEAARRRHAMDDAAVIMKRCDNLCLKVAFKQWTDRLQSHSADQTNPRRSLAVKERTPDE